MPQLSDSQLVVLTAACQRPDRCVFPVTAKLKGNAAGNVLKSLLKKDLIKEVRAKRDDTVWRHDEERGRMTLVATKAAFAALGIDPRDEAEDAEADAADEAPANVEAEPKARPKTPKTKEPKAPRDPRGHQAGATHCDAAPGKGSHHRRDRRGPGMAAAHGARRNRGRAEEEARARRHLGEGREARAGLQNRRLGRSERLAGGSVFCAAAGRRLPALNYDVGVLRIKLDEPRPAPCVFCRDQRRA